MTDLGAIYRSLEAELPAAGGECRACGMCCDFHSGELRLYASELEIEYLLQSGVRINDWPDHSICPYRGSDGLCRAHTHRTLGCRTHFCRIRDRALAEALYEKYLGEIKRLCERSGQPWKYRPVLEALAENADEIMQKYAKVTAGKSATCRTAINLRDVE